MDRQCWVTIELDDSICVVQSRKEDRRKKRGREERRRENMEEREEEKKKRGRDRKSYQNVQSLTGKSFEISCIQTFNAD